MHGDDFLTDWAAGDNGTTTENGAELTTADVGGEDGLEAGLVDTTNADQVDNGDGGETTEAESGTTTDTDHEEGNPVPYAALKSERAKRQAAYERAELAEKRQKDLQAEIDALRNPSQPRTAQPAETMATVSADAPDFWTDPTKYVEHFTNQRIEQAIREVQTQQHFRQIEDRQRAQHADFDEVSLMARDAAMRDPKLAQRILTAADPGAELYTVGKQIKDYQDLTQNPEAYREKVRQEILAEMGGADGQDDSQVATPTTRRTVDLSTRRNAKSDSSAAPPDPFKVLFPE